MGDHHLRKETIIWFHMLLLLRITLSQTTIKSIPGFNGNLPFELETGYISVDESNDVQLFYYFVKSERNPKADPLLLWYEGGPGCSSICGLAFEIGPLYFKIEEYNGSLPTLVLNPNSWTKVANIIFLESPVGTGFSYSRTVQGSCTSDIISSQQAYTFLRKWLNDHPEFLPNPLYVGSISYSGLTVPIVVQDISDGNQAGYEPHINLKGYVLVNPGADGHAEGNYRIPFAHGMGLVSDELYESIKKNCDGEYVNVDLNNKKCINDIQAFTELTADVNEYHILEPKCIDDNDIKAKREIGYALSNSVMFRDREESPKAQEIRLVSDKRYKGRKSNRRSLQEYSSEVLVRPPSSMLDCRYYGYRLAYYWANNASVRKALHVKKGTVERWIRCNNSIPYIKQFNNTVNFHRNLSARGYRSLIYSGDHDLKVPFLSTQSWVRSLNYSIAHDWRPWYIDDQVAGYTRTYSNDMTLVTVKGAGHEVPMYKPKECIAVFSNWISSNPLYLSLQLNLEKPNESK